MANNTEQAALDQKILDAINSLDWSQAEFGYTPLDDDYIRVLTPIIEAEATRREQALLDELLRSVYDDEEKAKTALYESDLPEDHISKVHMNGRLMGLQRARDIIELKRQAKGGK